MPSDGHRYDLRLFNPDTLAIITREPVLTGRPQAQ